MSKQKSDDIRDLVRRLISALAGVHAHALANIPCGSVLVARCLLPSDKVFLARNMATAALLELGGKGSHAALFAREIGLPCIAGIEVVSQVLKELTSKGTTSRIPKIGAMIAALTAPDILKYAEFLSFGTNDLTQYSFAADRENEAVDIYFDDTHDVIFRLIRTVHDDVPNIPLSVCGELAVRSESVSRLVKCGITSVSVVPSLIPAIKEAVRSYGKVS